MGGYGKTEESVQTYSASGIGSIITTKRSLQTWALQATPTGAVTSWNIVLEGSLNGTNFSTIGSHTNTDGSNTIIWAAGYPCRYFRTRCASITLGLGTNVVVQAIGVE